MDVPLAEDIHCDARLRKEASILARLWTALHIVNDGTEASEYPHQRADVEDAGQPAIIPPDLNLSGVDGWEILDDIKSTDELKRNSVIVLTGSDAGLTNSIDVNESETPVQRSNAETR